LPIDAPVSVQAFAQDCNALLDHLNIPRGHVVGHSMEGLIALELMYTAPQKIASLTLAATAPIRLARNLALFKALLAVRQSNAPSDTWLRAVFPWLFAPAIYHSLSAVDEAAAASLAYAYAQTAKETARQLDALEGYAYATTVQFTCPDTGTFNAG
jgi:pimeloyl-ACP methyl ester carboxylesterase